VFTNAHNGSPKIVAIFLFPCQNARIAHRRVDKGKQAGIIAFTVVLFHRHLTNDLIIKTRRRSEPV